MRVAAIVPAYNEEKTIAGVVEILLQCPLINQIVVVSDGSTDRTAAIAKNFPIKVVELEENVGKGGAMKAGAMVTEEEILLFIDADLVGLRRTHLEKLLNPVLAEECSMSVGVFAEGRLPTDLAQKIAPSLSGQRAVKRELFESVPKLERSRYGVELALTRYAEEHKINVLSVTLPELSQVMKEEKHGITQGFAARLKMYWEILKSIKD
ncbi:MAG: glycosyltransferase family 2 protein [Firmicutes bacterium]|nr:glycosyltransferase family 2 protein [Bacillota bacterium]